jgi:transcriptional regulator with XRE-family HTH domain
MRNFLKAIRLGRGLTLQDLSKESGYGVSTINNFENGRANASAEFLSKMARILNCESQDLLEGPAGTRIAEMPNFDYSSDDGCRAAFEWLLEQMPLPRLVERLTEILNDESKPAVLRIEMAKAILPVLKRRQREKPE